MFFHNCLLWQSGMVKIKIKTSSPATVFRVAKAGNLRGFEITCKRLAGTAQLSSGTVMIEAGHTPLVEGSSLL